MMKEQYTNLFKVCALFIERRITIADYYQQVRANVDTVKSESVALDAQWKAGLDARNAQELAERETAIDAAFLAADVLLTAATIPTAPTVIPLHGGSLLIIQH
jgi:hypothetical protein